MSTEVLGNPAGFRRSGDYEALRYTNRLISAWSRDRADYNVILHNSRVVEYGPEDYLPKAVEGENAMIQVRTIRDILNRLMQKERPYTLQEIYSLVRDADDFDTEDLEPSTDRPGGGSDKKWMRQVRNTLRIGCEKNQLKKCEDRPVYKRRCQLN